MNQFSAYSPSPIFFFYANGKNMPFVFRGTVAYHIPYYFPILFRNKKAVSNHFVKVHIHQGIMLQKSLFFNFDYFLEVFRCETSYHNILYIPTILLLLRRKNSSLAEACAAFCFTYFLFMNIFFWGLFRASGLF